MSDKPFSVDLKALKTKSKQTDELKNQKVEKVAEELGFIDREPKKKRGRPKSPRTGQVHAKVMPNVAEEIAAEARRRGVQQGVLIEEAWELYKLSGN